MPACVPVFTNSFASGECPADLGLPVALDIDAQPEHLVDVVALLGQRLDEDGERGVAVLLKYLQPLGTLGVGRQLLLYNLLALV